MAGHGQHHHQHRRRDQVAVFLPDRGRLVAPKVLFDLVENVCHAYVSAVPFAPWPSLRAVDVRNPRVRLIKLARNIAADPGDGKPSPRGGPAGFLPRLSELERFLLKDGWTDWKAETHAYSGHTLARLDALCRPGPAGRLERLRRPRRHPGNRGLCRRGGPCPQSDRQAGVGPRGLRHHRRRIAASCDTRTPAIIAAAPPKLPPRKRSPGATSAAIAIAGAAAWPAIRPPTPPPATRSSSIQNDLDERAGLR